MDAVNSCVFQVTSLPRFEERFKEIAKRAKRLGMETPTFEIVRRFSRQKKVGYDSHGVEVFSTIQYVEVQVTGQRAVLPGWETVANLVRAKTLNVVRTRPGMHLPEEFRSRHVCDHCKTTRVRKETWVLRHQEDGDLMQIGRNCLKDFLGSPDINPASLAFEAELWGLTDPDSWDNEGGGSRYFSVEEYLAAAVATVRAYGWCSRSATINGTATADLTWITLTPTSPDAPKVTPEDYKTAANALEWLANSTETSDFIHNLKAAVELGYATHKTGGYLAALVGSAYPRAVMAQMERTVTPPEPVKVAPKSDYIGQRGGKVDLDVVVEKVHGWATEYGYTTLFKFRTADGNAVSWYCSTSVDLDQGDRCHVRGTIKTHEVDRYSDEKTTILTRCKVSEVQKSEEENHAFY